MGFEELSYRIQAPFIIVRDKDYLFWHGDLAILKFSLPIVNRRHWDQACDLRGQTFISFIIIEIALQEDSIFLQFIRLSENAKRNHQKWSRPLQVIIYKTYKGLTPMLLLIGAISL